MYYITMFGRITELSKVESAKLFANNPALGTYRGYIWNRSIPLLKSHILVGSGADTFCAVFPQNDIAGRFTNNAHNDGTVIDKPHNVFLGVGINTGCISLLAFLALFAGYLVQALKLLWHRDYKADFIPYISVGILTGTIGFLVAGFFNDSSVSTMPMLYTMLGIGIASNMLLGKADKEAE